LAPGMVCLCLVSPLFSIMQGIGKADMPVKFMMLGVAVKLLGNLILIPLPSLSVTGAGISTSICYCVMLLLALLKLRKELGGLKLIKTMLPVIYASLMSGGGAYIINSVLRDYGTFVQLAGAISAAVLIYGIVLFLLGHSGRDIRDMLSMRI
ncbi:MAG: polysaccharide biosynthesis C-terminal domain-containing protein, partial [Oscillospiraceae bacterium]|nr:polysaccharide biosynthesis C-terminal domain-containing protein [Oscillospiraceae bacterium]